MLHFFQKGFHLILLQQAVGFPERAEMRLHDLLCRLIECLSEQFVSCRDFGFFLGIRHAKRQLHFKFLIPLHIQAPAKAVYTRLTHLACIRQIRNGHKKHLSRISQHEIRDLFLCFCQRMIGFFDTLYEMILLHNAFSFPYASCNATITFVEIFFNIF